MTVHISGTNQEVFDRCCAHLARQGRRAADGSSEYASCRYRTGDGLRCAIGGLLPDDAPFADLDRSPGGTLIETFIRFGTITADADTLVLAALQDAHDGADDLGDLLARLAAVAEDFSLNPAAVAQIERWER